MHLTGLVVTTVTIYSVLDYAKFTYY